jgi:hypothetical protein
MVFKDKKFVKPSKQTTVVPSRHVYLAGLGHQMGTDRETLRAFLISHFGPLATNMPVAGTNKTDGEDKEESEKPVEEDEEDDGIYMPQDRRYCIASFPTLEASIAAYEFFSNEEHDVSVLGASRILTNFAQQMDNQKLQKSPEAECTSTTASVVVPGLVLIENFVTEDEAVLLMAELGDECAPWRESLCRRVQHYGFIFNYRTIMVDYAKPTPPLPASCVDLAKKILTETSSVVTSSANESPLVNLKDEDGSLLPLNQLTVNEYLPGQGIASHTGERFLLQLSFFCCFLFVLC